MELFHIDREPSNSTSMTTISSFFHHENGRSDPLPYPVVRDGAHPNRLELVPGTMSSGQLIHVNGDYIEKAIVRLEDRDLKGFTPFQGHENADMIAPQSEHRDEKLLHVQGKIAH